MPKYLAMIDNKKYLIKNQITTKLNHGRIGRGINFVVTYFNNVYYRQCFIKTIDYSHKTSKYKFVIES